MKDLEHRYAGSDVLRLPSWTLGAGERCAVLGRSGSGKSTFLHALSGLLRPSAGRIRVGDTDITALEGRALDRWRGTSVGIVLQALHLVPHLDVRANLRLAQYLAGLPQDDARIAEALGPLGVADKAARLPRELSQGEQQRVAIARAVVNGPKLVLADEPTANLDDESAARAIDLLADEASRRGATLVVATHDVRVRARFPSVLELGA